MPFGEVFHKSFVRVKNRFPLSKLTLWAILGGGTKTLAGAIVNIKRTKVTNLAIKNALKVLEGAWGNEIFRLRNISVATERCVVLIKKFPHKKITLTKLLLQEVPPAYYTILPLTPSQR